MASLDMSGPYNFTTQDIDRAVTRTSPGNYALGREDEDVFHVSYVGRSDTDVRQELKAKLNQRYSHFKFSYATSPKAAFEKECHNYHDFGGREKLVNEIHPRRPDGTNWRCPVCDIF